MTRVTEKTLEAKLLTEIKKRGGVCVKFVSPGNNGVPDRKILMPGGRIWYAEIKGPHILELEGLQLYWQKTLRRLGFKHYLINSEESLNKLLNEVDTL